MQILNHSRFERGQIVGSSDYCWVTDKLVVWPPASAVRQDQLVIRIKLTDDDRLDNPISQLTLTMKSTCFIKCSRGW